MSVRRSHLGSAWAALALGRQAAGGTATVVLVLTALASAAPVVTAWLTKIVLDALSTAGAAPTRLMTLMAFGAAVTGGGIALGHAASFLTLRMQYLITLHAQRQLYTAINRFIGLGRFEDPEFADRLRLAEDAAKDAPGVLVYFLASLARSTVTIASFSGVLFTIWPPMAALLLSVVAAAVVSQLAVARRQVAIAHATMSTQRRQLMYQQLLSDLRSAKEIRLFGLGPLFQSRMVEALRSATTAEVGVHRRSSLVQAAMALLGSIVAAVGAIVVVRRAALGQLTAGDLMLFVAAAASVQAAAFGIVGQLQDAVRSTRLFTNYLAVVDAPPDLADGDRTPEPLHSAITFDDVWFRYAPDGPWVLRGVTLTVPAGQAVGLVGLNGAGKSTLVKLLCRFYDPERGHITWDGIDIRDFQVAAYRRRLGATFQDFQVYDMTVHDNIGIGDADSLGDDRAVRQAAHSSGADEFIEALPRGYRTMLSRVFTDEDTGTLGVQLSGGQGQRLALARSLMRDEADLLILDEPSSGLDAEAEHALHDSLQRHGRGRTSLLISHRLGAMRTADKIVVLSNGAIGEQGTHDQLMTHAGGYADLFSLQAAGYQAEQTTVSGLPEGFEFKISAPIAGRS